MFSVISILKCPSRSAVAYIGLLFVSWRVMLGNNERW